MWALPSGWRKMTKRRLPLIVIGGAAVVLSADLALHVLKDVVSMVRSKFRRSAPKAVLVVTNDFIRHRPLLQIRIGPRGAHP